MRHVETHRTQRIGWLRAAVLGANDGIVSTASLVLGVAAAGADSEGILVAGVAGHLMQHDALGAHARDELGISANLAARPIQAALASAGTFLVGAILPLLIVMLFPVSELIWAVSGSSLLFLALLGSLSAKAGGAPVLVAAARVTFWGALAMALTAGVGALFGVVA